MKIFFSLKVLLTMLMVIPSIAYSNDLSFNAFEVIPGANGSQKYSVSLQVLAMMTMLTLLPTIILMMTSFTRVVIVLSILRQAIGMPQTPGNQIIIGISLFLSFFIMSPVLTDIYDNSVKPFNESKISQIEAVTKAMIPIKSFMYNQIREEDLALFSEISGNSTTKESNHENIPLSVLVPSFVTSELKTAFQIGFIIFIPFLIIDLVVASVLMSMGMMMLSPLIISLPFKIMLFVLVDGWNLVLGTLASSFLTL